MFLGLSISLLWCMCSVIWAQEPNEEYIICRTRGYEDVFNPHWDHPSFDHDYFHFRVRACGDAEITLFPDEPTEIFFTVVLGVRDNQLSVIRKNAQDVVVMDTPNVLSCDEDRDFWIRWSAQEGALEFGRGLEPGEFVIGVYVSGESFRAERLSIATLGEHVGYWGFPRTEVANFKYMAYSVDEYHQLWWTEFGDRHFTIFHAKACRDVHVMLSPELGDDDIQRNYRFHIGEGDNSRASLFEGEELVVEAATPGILRCEEHVAFWIDWNEGLRLGVGTVVGERMIIFHHPHDQRETRAVSVNTFGETNVEFVLNYVGI